MLFSALSNDLKNNQCLFVLKEFLSLPAQLYEMNSKASTYQIFSTRWIMDMLMLLG
jgi:hypothetical protein